MTDGIDIKTTRTVSWERVADMFVGALEGGSNYWVYSALRKTLKDYKGEHIWYSNGDFWAKPGVVVAVKHDAVTNEQDDGEGTWTTTITQADIIAGLQIMADKHPTHFNDLVDENDDANTADVFLQLVVLKEIVFG